MTMTSSRKLLLTSACLLAVSGCASVEPIGATAATTASEAQKMLAQGNYAYTGSRIPSRFSTNHVVQVVGQDYDLSLPPNPGNKMMTGGGPGSAR